MRTFFLSWADAVKGWKSARPAIAAARVVVIRWFVFMEYRILLGVVEGVVMGD
jgi:hypothetical protein